MRLSIFHSTSRALREFFLVLGQGYERAPRVSQLPIKTNDSDTTAGILNARSINGDGAGIGGGGYFSCSNITIKSCSVIASSKYGAGIGGG